MVKVRAVVSEATKIGMSGLPSPDPALKALIRLVKGDYNKFLAEQFKKVCSRRQKELASVLTYPEILYLHFHLHCLYFCFSSWLVSCRPRNAGTMRGQSELH